MLIFLDLKTTGFEKNDKICSMGLIVTDAQHRETRYELFNEGKKISSKASSLHHITNEMLKNKPNFIQSDIYRFLISHNNQDTTLVTHNVKLLLDTLLLYNISWKGGVIDTFRVVKHLISECEFFSLQFLRYELKLYYHEEQQSLFFGINPNIIANNALDDALITKLLYDYLLDYATIDEMYELSFKNVLVQKIGFGKYADRYIEDIVINDRKYLQWLLRNITDMDEDLRYSIEYYLKG